MKRNHRLPIKRCHESFTEKYTQEKALHVEKRGAPSKEDLKTEKPTYLNLRSVWDLPDKRVVLDMTVDKQVVEIQTQEPAGQVVLPRSHIEIKVMMKAP